MIYIKYIGKRKGKTGNYIESWGLFFCEYCEQFVEKPISAGNKCNSCGCIQYLKSEETKQKIRKAKMGKKLTEEHKHRIKEFKQIKKYILKRDSYQCQEPYWEEEHSILHVHHIDYNKQNNNTENLVTLGNSCHIKTNYNREYWIKFYKNIMLNKLAESLL